jgi:hypothetical protein
VPRKAPMRQMAKTAFHLWVRTTFGETTRVENSSVAVLRGLVMGNAVLFYGASCLVIGPKRASGKMPPSFPIRPDSFPALLV